MKKFLKWLLGLAAVGTGIGLIIAYFCKDSDAVSEYDCTEDMEEEDFLNLQNGLFIVNVSNTSNTELTLGAPEHITVSPIQFSGRTLHIPVLYTFGTIDFYMERVSIKE